MATVQKSWLSFYNVSKQQYCESVKLLLQLDFPVLARISTAFLFFSRCSLKYDSTLLSHASSKYD